MASKIGNLSELDNVLCDFEKTNKGVLGFIPAFGLKRLLCKYNVFKSKGFSVSILLLTLILLRLKGERINRMSENLSGFLPRVDDNTLYRITNNPMVDWRRLLLGFAKQFKRQVESNGDPHEGFSCFIVDDTDLPKTGKTFEFISRIFNHVTKTYQLGYKLLLLAWWDGKSLISCDFSLHREAGRSGNYGLSSKERNNQFGKKRDSACLSVSRIKELDESKVKNMISMLRRAVKNGFKADYVLMDSWFVNDFLIKGIRGIKNGSMHVLGLCKMDKRRYSSQGKLLNSKELIVRHERRTKKYSRKYKSHYIPLVVDYKGQTVKLFFIKYNNAANWSLLLTTDLKLNFIQAIERYQIRWSIEVLFKECKQYLGLGSSQNTDFDGQIADTTLAFITHTILTLQKRFGCYETMGGLFRQIQQGLLEMTLWQRLIRAFIQMVMYLLDFLSIDIEETMRKISENSNDKRCAQIMLMLEQISDKPKKSTSLGFCLA
jgi:hypothetical protein